MATTIIRGTTSVRLRFLLGVTGLSSSSSGLIISTVTDNEATATVYTQAASNIETITTLGTYAAPTSGKCRFREVDATNHPGLYEFQFADARFAVANSSRLAISVSGATGLAATGVHYEVDLLAQADVINWGGTAVASAAVRANLIEVNGVSAPSALGVLRVDVTQISGDQTAADNLESAYDGTGYATGGSALATAISNAVWDDTTAAHTTAGTFGKALGDTNTNVSTLLTRITSSLFTGITSLRSWLGALAGKTADTTTRAEINATTAGATYNETTDSLEALRDRGDAAWTSGSNVLAPVAGNSPDRVEETTLKAFVGETWSEQVGGLDANGNVIDFTTLGDLEFVLENNLGTDVVVIANADITKASTYFQVSIDDQYIGTVPTTMKWALRQVTNNKVVLYGPFVVQYAADN